MFAHDRKVFEEKCDNMAFILAARAMGRCKVCEGDPSQYAFRIRSSKTEITASIIGGGKIRSRHRATV